MSPALPLKFLLTTFVPTATPMEMRTSEMARLPPRRAARFVTGYLYSPVSDREGRVGGGATHAWVQIYVPGAGWMELDPTNGIIGNRDLIRVAVVRDSRQAVPLSGDWTGFPSDHLGMTVEVESARHKVDHDGTTYYFCAPGCARAFEKDPADFI